MTHISTLNTAESLPYAGDVRADDAWQFMKHHVCALIDVRTPKEWSSVGVVDTSDAQSTNILLSLLFDNGVSNPDFATQLAHHVPDKDMPLFFLCKIGGRSARAAALATEMGYHHAYNIAHGFEGIEDSAGLRGTINGWKAEGLPWNMVR
ncbi:MAG: rhodanese-like domain-containing protein [Alphaproteobacteria bacterium]|nr:MAG: rhodanese-like domain-containing protein [Alphaproteobacteria bacterium]TAF15000.1 MAG: rhodanese-like domain-containing protein [Alphaproteobacteria bacterium]TAF40430.1 MAG: rhodanese-like domain-containing protein [Alphaproteobacteria bacterium]TAF76624.1 MAG: rhodanese-like domain-containing protein [Alphaproteobacteria bacterium]